MIADSDPSKTIRKEMIKRMRDIGIDINKRKCVVCVMDNVGRMLEETAYDNTLANAKEFAGRMKREYGEFDMHVFVKFLKAAVRKFERICMVPNIYKKYDLIGDIGFIDDCYIILQVHELMNLYEIKICVSNSIWVFIWCFTCFANNGRITMFFLVWWRI